MQLYPVLFPCVQPVLTMTAAVTLTVLQDSVLQ